MNDKLLDLLEYILKNSPVEKQDLLKDVAAVSKISERTVRRNLDLLQKRGIVTSTDLEYNAGKLLEISDTFKGSLNKKSPQGG